MTGSASCKSGRWAFVAATCRFLAGGAFLFAAFNKLAGPEKFALDINALEMVPQVLVPAVAFLVPWTEVVVGVCLLYGFWSRAAGWIATIVYSGFTVVLVSAMVRGLDASCGCFGDALGTGAINSLSILRNGIFVAASLVVALAGGGPASLDAVIETGKPTAPGPVCEGGRPTLTKPASLAE